MPYYLQHKENHSSHDNKHVATRKHSTFLPRIMRSASGLYQPQLPAVTMLFSFISKSSIKILIATSAESFPGSFTRVTRLRTAVSFSESFLQKH